MGIKMAWLIHQINKRTLWIQLMAKDMEIKIFIFKCKTCLNLFIDTNRIILTIKINKFKVNQVLICLKLKVQWVVLLTPAAKGILSIHLLVLLTLEVKMYQCLMQDHQQQKKWKEMLIVILVEIGTFLRLWVMMNYLLLKLCQKEILMLQSFHSMAVQEI